MKLNNFWKNKRIDFLDKVAIIVESLIQEYRGDMLPPVDDKTARQYPCSYLQKALLSLVESVSSNLTKLTNDEKHRCYVVCCDAIEEFSEGDRAFNYFSNVIFKEIEKFKGER